jgi:hypothetical protein
VDRERRSETEPADRPSWLPILGLTISALRHRGSNTRENIQSERIVKRLMRESRACRDRAAARQDHPAAAGRRRRKRDRCRGRREHPRRSAGARDRGDRKQWLSPSPAVTRRSNSCPGQLLVHVRTSLIGFEQDCLAGLGGFELTNVVLKNILNTWPQCRCCTGVEVRTVQVFGRQQRRANHTARRPASEKRQGTKSPELGTRPCRERLWGFGAIR